MNEREGRGTMELVEQGRGKRRAKTAEQDKEIKEKGKGLGGEFWTIHITHI